MLDVEFEMCNFELFHLYKYKLYCYFLSYLTSYKMIQL